jgi:hypothetical protein
VNQQRNATANQSARIGRATLQIDRSLGEHHLVLLQNARVRRQFFTHVKLATRTRQLGDCDQIRKAPLTQQPAQLTDLGTVIALGKQMFGIQQHERHTPTAPTAIGPAIQVVTP